MTHDCPQPAHQNGFSNPSQSEHQQPSNSSLSSIEIRFEEIDGLEWNDELERVLLSLAQTGLPPGSSPSWSKIVQAILYCLKIKVQNYLKLGEPSLFDTREEPAGGWLWTSEDLQKNIDRVYMALKNFSEERHLGDQVTADQSDRLEQIRPIRCAPFTIQRLVELVFHEPSSSSTNQSGAHPHYTTLPKYFRAIQRVLSVSSPVMSFPVNTFTLSDSLNPTTCHSISTDPSSSRLNGIHHSPSILTSPRPRRNSSSTPITPILSPIPWLVNSDGRRSLSPELASSEGRRSRHTSPLLISAGSDERPITPPLITDTSPPPLCASTPPQVSSHTSPSAEPLSPTTLANPAPNIPREVIGSQSDQLKSDINQTSNQPNKVATESEDDAMTPAAAKDRENGAASDTQNALQSGDPAMEED